MLLAQEAFDVSQWLPWLVPILAAVVGLALLAFAFYFFTRGGADTQTVVLLKAGSDGPKEHEKKNQRNFLRRGGHPIDIIVSDEKAEASPIPGLVIDRSIKGMCLALDTAFDVGTIVSVKRTSPVTPWIRLQVKNCRTVSGTFEIGCEFVSVPPASVLMMFG